MRLPIVGGELQSLETTLQPTVFPFPGWVAWAITHLPNADTSFATRLAAPLVEYQYDLSYPTEPFEATWTPPCDPYLGGAELGIQPTQANFSVLGQSSGQGTVAAEAVLVGLAALTAVGRIFGQGETRFVCGESLDLPRAELGLKISVAVAKEIGLTDLIPAVRAAESWPVVGRIIRWVNSVAVVRGSLTPAVTVVTQFAEQNDELAFQSGEGTGRIAALTGGWCWSNTQRQRLWRRRALRDGAGSRRPRLPQGSGHQPLLRRHVPGMVIRDRN